MSSRSGSLRTKGIMKTKDVGGGIVAKVQQQIKTRRAKPAKINQQWQK